MVVTESQLDHWVRAHPDEAQGAIVELVWRLVAASAPKPKERRFPLGDSIGQHGPDGILNTATGYPPFVPDGRSLWEIGTGGDARKKANSVYGDLVVSVPADVRSEAVFVFVTPLSGRKTWEHTWKMEAQADWVEERRRQGDWRDVAVIDGTKLVDWLHQFPAVERWLTRRMGLPADELEPIEQHWEDLRTIGEPPPLIPKLFVANRDAAAARLREVLLGGTLQLQLDSRYPDQMVPFVAGYFATLDEETRMDVAGRCVVVGGEVGWEAVVAQRERHVLVANFDIDESSLSGTKLLERARRAGHGVIYGGSPGGIPHPNRESIANPRMHQVKEALESAGYKEERARGLAQKSSGNLGTLLRCLQNLSTIPAWAEQSTAAELVIAELLGSWSEKSEADLAAGETLLGKPPGEWIGRMREIAQRPGTPLTLRNGIWKFVSRYEGWYALGPAVFDQHLQRLRQVAVNVLGERDPAFELPSGERYMAAIREKVRVHSPHLRKGLAETLALLGSHPGALTSASVGMAETTATLAVRDILSGADAVAWAGLSDVLPYLAEAAPGEFLTAVETAVNQTPSPFVAVFAEEDTGVFGANYMTGLLWALETLAWESDYLARVILALGELATRDPGGHWANRPGNSITTILLPWLPQTTASIEKRRVALASLFEESPAVAWDTVMGLLPTSHQMSMKTRRPTWREAVPGDWCGEVTRHEYWRQIESIADMAIAAARVDLVRMPQLVERLADLPEASSQRLLAHLASDEIGALADEARLPIWSALTDLVGTHTEFQDAEWAMKPERLVRLSEIAQRLAPRAAAVRHRPLFSEQYHHLLDGEGSWREQLDKLEKRRQAAVMEVEAAGGPGGILEFGRAVESAWRVGFAYGSVAAEGAEALVLPGLLLSEDEPMAKLAGGLVRGVFQRRGWAWFDALDLSRWSKSEIGQILAYLPFDDGTWQRAERLLGPDEGLYWSTASVNPYEAGSGLVLAVERLVQHGRPKAALHCLHRMLYEKQPLDLALAIRALLAVPTSTEMQSSTDPHDLRELIGALQAEPRTDPEDLARVEWLYLPLLRWHRGATPKVLERNLAGRPEFYCELIRVVFRSRNVEIHPEPSAQTIEIAERAYQLLTNWETPPGSRDGLPFDDEAFVAWVEAVRRECQATGHLDVAMEILGQVLVHAPADADGAWIRGSVASMLNRKDSQEMREGFRTALFNLGGEYRFAEGADQGPLADRYRDRADQTEAAGFVRLATTLRELADEYDSDARREASREPLDD